MAIQVHELWAAVSDGMLLHTCCRAGPNGDECRRSLEPSARLRSTVAAGSYFEAMTAFNHYLGREPFTTRATLDFQPYPDEWLAAQPRHGEPVADPACGDG